MARKTYPNSRSRLAEFIDRRIIKLAPVKSQRDIAVEAGFNNANFVSMLKSGNAKLALDRVPALARALDADPVYVLLLALEQTGNESTREVFRDVLGTPVTRNEAAWLDEIRDASGNSDPRLTRRARAAIRTVFGK